MNKLTFLDKRKQWLEAVNGNDRHSIHTQLTRDAASFAVINEARRLAPVDSGGVVKLNGMMHRLVNRTFLITQSSAIRRLVDVYELEGKRGVFSLTGLLDDMMKHRYLMTRQALFDTEDLAYDYEPIRAEAEKYYQDQTKAGNRSFPKTRATILALDLTARIQAGR